MIGKFVIGLFITALLLMFIYDAQWIPESLRGILKTISMWAWGLVLAAIAIQAILTPPWLRYS